MFNSCGKLISRKYPVLPIKKSLLSYPWMPYCYSTLHKLQFIIQFPLHCLSSGRLAKENFKPPAPNCSCSLTRRGRLQEVPIEWFDFKTFGILENLSLKRGGRNRRFHCILFGSFCLPFYNQGLILLNCLNFISAIGETSNNQGLQRNRVIEGRTKRQSSYNFLDLVFAMLSFLCSCRVSSFSSLDQCY